MPATIPSDGCRVLPVAGGWAVGADMPAAWLVGHVWVGLAVLSRCPELANRLHRCADVPAAACGGVLAPDWAGVFCSWWRQADWVGGGQTFGRGPPSCHRAGPWGVGMMMERRTLGQPQFLHHCPRGTGPGEGR